GLARRNFGGGWAGRASPSLSPRRSRGSRGAQGARDMASPRSATGPPPEPPPCTPSCPTTCQILIDLLTEKMMNRSSPCPVDKLTHFCKALLEDSKLETRGEHVHGVQSPGITRDTGRGELGGGRQQTLDEFQIIKAVVLGLVTFIILLSICKMVFQLFVRYSAKADDRVH
ncbi:Citron Rho-interacting kinase, partial [Frankliniella fusca]